MADEIKVGFQVKAGDPRGGGVRAVRVTLNVLQRKVRSRYRRRISNQVTPFESGKLARHF